MLSFSRESLWVDPAQMPVATSSLCATNAVLYLNILQAMRASLLASATASLFQFMRSAALVKHSPKLKSGHQLVGIRITLAA